MAATFTNASFSATRGAVPSEAARSPRALAAPLVKFPWRATSYRGIHSRVASTPQGLSDQIAESVKKAEEACASNAESGECAAAWDEVEEVSAAASHLRDRQKDNDPLENYCKDHPEVKECRTYED